MLKSIEENRLQLKQKVVPPSPFNVAEAEAEAAAAAADLTGTDRGPRDAARADRPADDGDGDAA